VSTTRVIAEAFIAFDAEITLLTVRSVNGTFICPPIGHRQQAGDYVESWQPHWLPAPLKAKSEHIARTITEALGGLGLFGVELFVAGDLVYFSEVSPRPHDTGLVTLVSQDLSEFALHIRALLGLPLSSLALRQPAASRAIKAPWAADSYIWHGLEAALAVPGTTLRLFGKPTTTLGRRVGVVLNQADTVDQAREQAEAALQRLDIRPAEAQNALDWN
jgi:phosphoribosylglycinamide formyltransferase 2